MVGDLGLLHIRPSHHDVLVEGSIARHSGRERACARKGDHLSSDGGREAPSAAKAEPGAHARSLPVHSALIKHRKRARLANKEGERASPFYFSLIKLVDVSHALGAQRQHSACET